MARGAGSVLGSAKAGFTIIIAIIVVSYGLFFYLEMAGEFKIREIEFERSTMAQVELVENAAHHAEHLLNQSLAKLYTMGEVGPQAGDTLAAIDNAHSPSLQGGGAVLLDEKGTVVWASPDMASHGIREGSDLSGRPWASPVQAPTFTGDEISNVHFVVVALPLYQEGRYAGHAAQFITQEAVSHILAGPAGDSPAMQLLDLEGRFVVHHDGRLIGQPFNSEGRTEELDALVQTMLAGDSEAASAVYAAGGQEYLAVASPVTVEGRPVYLALVHVPVAVFYQEINEVLTSQRIQSFSILAGTSVSVIILAIFVNRAVSLDREVRRRTKELEESAATIMQQKKELEQANEELKRLDAAKDEFLDVAAHEIRTPITPIMLAAEELEAQLGNRKDVKMILRNSKKLQHLVQNVLDVARMENKTFKLNLEKADLGEVVMAVVDDFKVQVEDRPGVKLVYKPVYVDVLVDRHRIVQVLSNVMSNAVKFTKQGDITVSISTLAGMAQVTVADSGPGIDPEIMSRLFQKFATRSEGGTGLGLYISRSIVEAHGGRIWAERREKGAAFSFTLPLCK